MENTQNHNYDWIDATLFLMIAHAEVTDYKLSDEEVKVIMEKADFFVSATIGDGVPYTTEDVTKKADRAYSWYMRIQEGVPEDQLDQKIIGEIQKVAKALKEEDWFNPDFAKNVILDMIDIARADGEIIPNEKGSINSLAEFWGVDKPF